MGQLRLYTSQEFWSQGIMTHSCTQCIACCDKLVPPLQTLVPTQLGVLVWPFLKQIEHFRTTSFPLQQGQAWTLELLLLIVSHQDRNTLRRRLTAWTIMSFASSSVATAFELSAGTACQLSSFLETRSCSFPLQRLSRLRSRNLGSCICLQNVQYYQQACSSSCTSWLASTVAESTEALC